MTHAPCIAPVAYPTYRFVPAQQGGRYFLLLVDTQSRCSEPLYVMVLDTSAQWDVAAKWLIEREDRWQAWGALARFSPDELITHIDKLLDAEPMDPAVEACLLTESQDGRVLTLSEILRDRLGCESQRPVWRRDFRSGVECRRAKAWILTSWSRLDDLALLASTQGAGAVDLMLDEEMMAAE